MEQQDIVSGDIFYHNFETDLYYKHNSKLWCDCAGIVTYILISNTSVSDSELMIGIKL